MKPDVLVVGAGPVGLTMAAELARYGIAVRIVDKAAQRTDKSKALVVWSRTLELMDRMACTQAFISAGFKASAMNVIAGGKPVGHVSLDAIKSIYPFALMLPQSETERLMEEHLASHGVAVERSCEIIQFTPSADSVTAILKHADDREETLEVSWLIGCDGAHSTVRHGLGIQFEGNTQPSDWILADIHLSGVQLPPDELGLFWHSDGVLALFPISPGRYRIIADVGQAKANEHRPDPTLAEIQAVMDRRGPGGMIASSPIWLASFRINERKVADYRVGRVFLAGDAAHIHSPAGGQGMNTGMQDACNLAWKLAMVIRGLVNPEPLLGSYSIERSAVGRQVLKDAGRLTSLAILRSGIAQDIRNHIASLVFGLTPIGKTMANRLAELTVDYPKSPLTRAGHHSGGPAPGERAPVTEMTSPVGAGDTPRFALFAPGGPEAENLIARFAGVLEPNVRTPFADSGIWLVRPDGYVATAADKNGWPRIEEFLRDILRAAN
jgi:2-polyprenyl-6-methoxyphenol hydroxylase-like FAD-dependent oxidoreductase